MKPDVLGRILRDVRKRLAERKKICPERSLIPLARSARPKDFIGAIRGRRRLSIIAELKRASPSSPDLARELDPVAFARRYRAAGAAALSVLTEQDHFAGSLRDLVDVARGVPLPVLRKDFTVDPYQIYEARACGASAVLLIVRALTRPRLVALHRLARRIGLAALVEVHDERELETALSVGARLIGVNNRNLSTLKTDLGVARRLIPLVPRGVVAVAESGYSSLRELAELRGLADAALIGAAFLQNPRRLKSLFVSAPPFPTPPPAPLA